MPFPLPTNFANDAKNLNHARRNRLAEVLAAAGKVFDDRGVYLAVKQLEANRSTFDEAAYAAAAETFPTAEA